MKNEVLTSVKVNSTTFEDFKIECIKYKFNLTKLVNTAMLLYVNDEEFRNKMTIESLKNKYEEKNSTDIR